MGVTPPPQRCGSPRGAADQANQAGQQATEKTEKRAKQH